LVLAFFFLLLLDQKEANIVIHTFFLIKKYAKTQGRTKLLPTGLYAGPPFSFLVFFIHTFFLIKKYAKNQGRTMLLPTGLYAGPPFCRPMAFYSSRLSGGCCTTSGGCCTVPDDSCIITDDFRTA
jgi:hypothetical protein